MKTKTLLELLTLISSLYYLAKDTQLIEKLNELSEKGKGSINKAALEPHVDEDGNEMEFVDRVIFKIGQLKDELEQKIEDSAVKFYKKVNIAHLDEIRALHEKLEQSDRTIALLEARLNKMETKK